MSALAGETARMIELGFEMYRRVRALICSSISPGWSAMGIYGIEIE
jgi:hypothetical protein